MNPDSVIRVVMIAVGLILARLAGRQWIWIRMTDGHAKLAAGGRFAFYLASSIVVFVMFFLEAYRCHA